ADVKADVESAVTDLKALLNGEPDTAALRVGVERLATVSQRVGQAMYQESGAATASGPEAGPGAEPSEGAEGVVDAEIVDEDGGDGEDDEGEARKGGGKGAA
ncbi:molecular chaperone DnaK, partial [Streptomyces sp. C1-2]|nr:molecular chaperone DnaK [Streptomyces sp. C1-2]